MLENARTQLFLCLLSIVGALVCILMLKPMYGPDLKGGTQLIYEVPEDVLEKRPACECVGDAGERRGETLGQRGRGHVMATSQVQRDDGVVADPSQVSFYHGSERAQRR